MDFILTIFYATIVLTILVFVHECGHFFAARAFGVRVTEFMLGLPGPSIGFTWKGTRFGITAIPLLGGYARICGMEPGEQSPHLEKVLAFAYRQGRVHMEDVARGLLISNEEAFAALEELTEWGSLVGPAKKDTYNIYRTPAVKGRFDLGQVREVEDESTLFESEYKQQYRSKPFWKRMIMLLGGIILNLLFAIVLFVLIYSVIGVDFMNTQTGEIEHFTVNPWRAIVAGFTLIGMVVQAVAGLFNPATAAETISGSASVIGIAIMSKTAAEQGFINFLFFMAMISISLGIMNFLPIPPLDGGRLIIEIVQKFSRKHVSMKIMNYLVGAGLLLLLGLFVVLIFQDVQRIFDGFWWGEGGG
ncbi:MAG: M50 family metallopeptidase [Eggerthellaceae bacterium]|jgi:regulator of sigma E protease|nr:M50 family metallopeptidase [Eggerthellaceae bacterium]MDR2721549.1 M50 family metallopeptidase [Coriobacteriaceae bacterium]